GLFHPAADEALAAQRAPSVASSPPRPAPGRPQPARGTQPSAATAGQPGAASEQPGAVSARTVRFRRLPDRTVLSTDSHVAGAPGARISSSRYETTGGLGTYDWQGCRAGKGHVGGLVILDFGMPAYDGHTYGTILFGGSFVAN